MQHLVEMRKISKSFGEVQALDKVSIHIDKGEIVALLGENGAGKTTLMNILYGLYKPDHGEIFVEGKKVKIKSPKDALFYKIAMVHQHFKLIPNFTVLENILIGSVSGVRFDTKSYEDKISDLSKSFGLEVNLHEKVKDLSVGIKQRVEILRALFRDSNVLILDEPTTNLTPQEADALIAALKKLSNAGLSIVFITHKVKEAMSVADRIIVLRAGRLMGELENRMATEQRVIELMMGAKDIKQLILFSHDVLKNLDKPEKEILAVEDLKVERLKGEVVVNGVSFQLRSKEILGVAGVSGNGQRELVEALAGVRRPISGKVLYGGIDITGASPNKLLQLGIAYIPEDRIEDGLLPTMSVAENIILGHHKSTPFSRNILIDWKKIYEIGETYVRELKVKTPNVKSTAGNLSGGNIQKLQIIRALLGNPKIVLAHNPTRGLDIATTDMVLRKFLELRNNGGAVLFISEDLDELMAICDRIIVMYKGQIVGALDKGEFDRYKIGAMMAGMREVERWT